ncbi:MAG: ribose 5-phosphate isomerase B [Clostridiales bacterium]|jgi:ribose 5-phosphate isomerase B|nr:ribose 5-phosphate isomerase B [Clostridiales bacterium]MDR2751512.1 ribose 5-phosphate isomerase B [Clostridiales bacterium]
MIALASDHGGFKLKEALIAHLNKKGESFKDLGIYSEAPADYPDIAEILCKAVLSGECAKGVIVCGTGIGVSIASNRLPGIRAALCHDPFDARLSRQHNDANVLALGGRVTGPDLACATLDEFLNTDFSGDERHKARINKIEALR